MRRSSGRARVAVPVRAKKPSLCEELSDKCEAQRRIIDWICAWPISHYSLTKLCSCGPEWAAINIKKKMSRIWCLTLKKKYQTYLKSWGTPGLPASQLLARSSFLWSSILSEDKYKFQLKRFVMVSRHLERVTRVGWVIPGGPEVDHLTMISPHVDKAFKVFYLFNTCFPRR